MKNYWLSQLNIYHADPLTLGGTTHTMALSWSCLQLKFITNTTPAKSNLYTPTSITEAKHFEGEIHQNLGVLQQ